MTQENKEAIAKAPSGRVKRTPVGGRNILTVSGKDPNFVYRIVNDEDDRITRFKEGGYELVPDETVKVGDNRANAASSMSSFKQLSVGGGKKAYLMRIRKEWYDEDQKEKQKRVDEQEATTKKKALSGTYGTLSIGNDT